MGDRDQGLRAKQASVKTAKTAAVRGDSGKELRSKPRQTASPRAARSMTLVPAMMGTALLLGMAYLATFVSVAFFPTGVPGAFSGQVVNVDAAPIPNATIVVEGATSNVTTYTDEGGNFTLTNISSGKTVMVVSKANYTSVRFILYVLPAPAAGAPPPFRDQLPLPAGNGTVTADFVSARDQLVSTCLVVLVIGNLLTGVGVVATITKRRYKMVVLGGIGSVLSIGFYMGPLMGIVATILARSARDQFKDQRGLFTPSEVPPLRGAQGGGDGEDEAEDSDEGEAEDSDEGEAEDSGEGEDEGGEGGEAPEDGDTDEGGPEEEPRK
jgi:hypothetical protein